MSPHNKYADLISQSKYMLLFPISPSPCQLLVVHIPFDFAVFAIILIVAVGLSA
jgi:hypothetical protein